MQIYLVGGAVRDKLLNYPVHERDWVVVGATPEELTSQGYRRVGKDFPVFLHPKTQDEYALARTERKQGHGYYGFELDFDQNISLQQDLLRRDLTINAIAEAEDGTLIDPYGGQQDLEARLLRHVSNAFVEDPLRVFRVARFHARYHHLGFKVATETLELMKQIAQSGELHYLPAERIWKETERALSERSPQVYFQTLRDCGALKEWFEEVDNLWGVPNPERWHPEIDTGVHTMMVLEQAARLSDETAVRFAALCHDLGKAITPKDLLPRHHGHEKSGVPLVNKLCKRIKAPNKFQSLAAISSEFHLHLHRLEELRTNTIIKVLERTDAFRKRPRFEQFLLVCEADYRGRAGFEDRPYPQRQIMLKALDACLSVDSKAIAASGLKGPAIAEAIRKSRIEKVAEFFDDNAINATAEK